MALASEVDNFTARDAPLGDSTLVINKAANRILDQAIDRANKRKGQCNKEHLYKEIKVRFRNHYQDKFSRFVHKSNTVERRHIKIKDSIYAKLNLFDSFVVGGLGAFVDSTASVVRMGQHQIGSDKFEHFFGRGYAYFNKYYLKNQKIEEVLNYGLASERGTLGAIMTGIASYADLSANFKGMHFWNHLLGEGADLLKFENPMGPYIACNNGKWQRTQDIDLLPYVDDSWDEAINCSVFRTKKILKKVQQAMNKLSQKEKRPITCPIDPNILLQLSDSFGPYAPYVINQQGHSVLSKKQL